MNRQSGLHVLATGGRGDSGCELERSGTFDSVLSSARDWQMRHSRLRVLLVEATEQAARAVYVALKSAGCAPIVTRVSHPEGTASDASRGPWDIVACNCDATHMDARVLVGVLENAWQASPFLVRPERVGGVAVMSLIKAPAAARARLSDLPGLVAAIDDVLGRPPMAPRTGRLPEGPWHLARFVYGLTGSLDVDVILAMTASFAVGTFAHSCVVDLVTEEDGVEHVGVAHTVPRFEAAMRARRQSLADRGVEHPLVAFRQAPSPRTVTTIDAATLEALALGPALELGSSPVPTSALFVPLGSQDRCLGMIAMARVGAQPRFDDDDLARAVELADRATAALENASLFRQAQLAKASAEMATRVKEELLSVVLHELRTPVLSVLGHVHHLLSREPDDERERLSLEVIERNARLQARLLDDLVDFARVSRETMRVERAPVRLAPVLVAAVETVRPIAEARSVRLKTAISDDTISMSGDAGRLEQVVTNLLDNAIRFTPREGHVTVSLEQTERDVEIRVVDTGEGIEPSFLPHVFDRFQQGSTGPARAHGGLGMGLSIVKHLVELHDGRVEAHSDGVGCGATIVVCLPRS